ncbi:MAG: family 20 glycosylhydrolase [Proteobacteria bacterium]|nr:family 20 glycosylhydrolase [Pseudomonadota bacterium]
MTAPLTASEHLLVPAPRQLNFSAGTTSLNDGQLIVLNTPEPLPLGYSIKRLQEKLAENAGVSWQVVAGSAVPQDLIGVRLNQVPGSTYHPQGYDLTITANVIDIVAATAVGLHYGCLTLCQLLQQYERELPLLRIQDWPDFPNRGVMLDISRDKVPTMETLYGLVDKLAAWKINQIQLYTEHTFAYQKHPIVWEKASPMTGEQILALDAYCRDRFIELVPNQNTFGHMYRWLRHPEYLPLAEIIEGAQTPWGTYWKGPYSLSPADPGGLDLVRDMLDELLPHFSSSQVNVGCDETFDLGKGRSKKRVEKEGVGRVYLDFLLRIYREVSARGHTMHYWGDIIMEHSDLVPDLPRDAIAMEWGYEADHPFDEHGTLFAASGIPFYVCPGTSSWRTLAGRSDNAIENLRNAALNGLKHGAVGYLNTDWGDDGHWQPLPVSYLGFLYGAALSWGYDANLDLDIASALDQYVFQDHRAQMGPLVYELGNIYQMPGILFPNSSLLFSALQTTPDAILSKLAEKDNPTDLVVTLQVTLDRIEQLSDGFAKADMHCLDAALVKREFVWICNMLKHACHRLLWVIDGAAGNRRHTLSDESEQFIADYEGIWHARNRSGGFVDSVGRMERMRQDYLAETG